MRIRGVDFPDSLLRAQKEGRLVIFAGAGVSMPSPSNYPNLDNLAEQVAGGVLARGHDEPIDRFLGRLVDKKVKVHERVREMLSNPSSSPNPLHFDLLRLFEGGRSLRLVTTNFDAHFTTAARTMFAGQEPDVYYAPALPLGDQCRGVVYLHGGVERAADQLVLTDADFGRAYITKGWARRFLQELFAKYTVLFVGYSHSDLVMEYLARGLPPQDGYPNRFALKIEGDADEPWVYRGIQPISYPQSSGDDRHAPLGPALAEWADDFKRTPIEHENKIKSIVQRPLSVNVEDLDYIESCLGDLTRARFFRWHAKREDWLTWIENKEAFARLFRRETKFTEIDGELSEWFAENFVCQNSAVGLSVVLRKGQLIGPLLTSSIARRLFTEKPRSTAAIATWVPILTSQQSTRFGDQFLEYILADSTFPEDQAIALILFEHLTRPEIVLKKNIWKEISEKVEDVNFELRTEGGEYWLQLAWRKFFLPHLAELGDQLVWIVHENLLRAHLLLRSTGTNNSQSDHLSLRRGMIESASQGTPHDGIGILINAACDLIEWSASARPTTIEFFIETWFVSDSRLFRRFAIFAVSKITSWTADKKIAWILKHELLYSYGIKHELFVLIQEAFPRASKRVQVRFLNRATRVRAENVHPYEVFNLLQWLVSSAPDCEEARSRLEKFSAQHPEFKPRARPDMDAWVGPVYMGLPSPVPPQELQSKTPEQLVALVSNFKTDDPLQMQGLMENIRDLASKSYRLGTEVARLMVSRDLWIAELWGTLVSSWRQLGLNPEQWEEVLQLLNSNERIIELCLYEVSNLLEEGTKGTAHDIPMPTIPAAKVVARKAWAAAERSDRGSEESDDWVFVAINHPAGTLLEFWLRALSKARQQLGDQWKGLPPEDEEFLSRVVSGSSCAAELGRVLIASQLNLLYSLDERWTVQSVVPLFSVSVGLKRAVQAWHGFLTWGGWDDRLLTHLLPKYEEAFPALAASFGKAREQFCNHLAGIALFSKTDPLSHGWLHRFLRVVGEDERVTWASSIRSGLTRMDDSAKSLVWSRWLGRYWKDRLEGVPVPLTQREGAQMVEWSIHLGPAFPEVVERILRTPIPDLQGSFMLTELSESDLRKQFPKAAASLVLYVLKNSAVLPWDTRWIDPLITELAGLVECKPTVRLVCDELARLGWPDAPRLKGLAS
jgi:hypothetical protein